MKHYAHLAAHIFNVPLLVHPGKLDAIIAGLGTRLLGVPSIATAGLVSVDEASADLQLPTDMFTTRRGKRHEAGYKVVDGVAVLFASGALVHRSRVEADSTYMVGYNELAAQLETAMDDPDVHAVLQVYDSPGGEVSGAFEYADRVHALRGKKPLWAIADDMAASAAYLGGSAAQRLAVAATGYLGSIGVVMRHVDVSRALANEGVQVTHIFAGAHKVDGNAFEPLAKGVRDDLQAAVDGLHANFVTAVARHRGLAEQAVRDTQARLFRGQAAVDLGLADQVATTDQLISELAALRARSHPVGQPARSNASTKGVPMSGNTQGGQQAAIDVTRESLERDHPALFGALRAEFTTAGAAAERDRIAAVRAQSLPGHEKLVEQLAADGTTTGPEAAAAVLAAERTARQAQAAALRADTPTAAPHSAAPTAGAPSADPSLPIAERAKAEWDASPALRADFPSIEAYQALRKAEESGRVRVLGGSKRAA